MLEDWCFCLGSIQYGIVGQASTPAFLWLTSGLAPGLHATSNLFRACSVADSVWQRWQVEDLGAQLDQAEEELAAERAASAAMAAQLQHAQAVLAAIPGPGGDAAACARAGSPRASGGGHSGAARSPHLAPC